MAKEVLVDVLEIDTVEQALKKRQQTSMDLLRAFIDVHYSNFLAELHGVGRTPTEETMESLQKELLDSFDTSLTIMISNMRMAAQNTEQVDQQEFIQLKQTGKTTGNPIGKPVRTI
jgi:hypothetical protein